MVITAILLGAQRKKDNVEKNPVNALVLFLKRRLNGFLSLCEAN